jgi:SAM-dependent methyltransferase
VKVSVADIVLEHPLFYRALHTITGLRKLHARLIGEVLRRYDDPARLRVLDLGCGPGDTLSLLGENAGYIGIDLNARYVALASRNSPRTASFVVGDATRLDPAQFRDFDLIIAFGLIHHLSDPDADALLSAASQILKPTGCLISLDGCRRDGTSPVVRWLLDHDRGRHIRREAEYLTMFSRHLHIETICTDASAMHIPYSILSVVGRPRERQRMPPPIPQLPEPEIVT